MKEVLDFFERKRREVGVSLNEVQKQAVLHSEGALLLLASPGSGKTTTMMMRIGFYIQEKGVHPSRIKAVTFSRAAANDMKERFQRFFPELPPVDFSTIHSLAFEVVREYLRKTQTHFQIIEGDTPDQWALNKKIILRKLFQSIVGENITEDGMEGLTTYISYIKNKMIPQNKWSSVKVDVPEAERILREYEAFKRSNQNGLLLDYDDMLTLGNQILGEDQEILRRYQQRYDYILTDESQDTSLVQHDIVEKLVERHGNLCVVADDDQSIYSWRGAEPSYLLRFKDVYRNAEILFMEQNYRSSKEIVSVANQFIKHNKNRYNKNMFTENPSSKPISIKRFRDYVNQSKYLVQKIGKIENLAEVAVLYRNHSSSISLMNEFDRAGIPFYMKDADNRFFSHWIVQDILNFMRMTFTDKRPDILEKIHLKFNGYISKQQMEALKNINNKESVFDNLLRYVAVQDYQKKLLKECKATFQQMRGMPPLPAIRVIRERLGYEKSLEKTCERLGFKKETLFGILNTLEEIADTLETMEQFASRLKHLESILKVAKSRSGQHVVTFSTLHSSKGLEFERVYMIDLIDGVIPSKDDRGNDDLMEEATRLFYVGMTRSKKQLELLYYRDRDGEEVAESPFVTAVRQIMNPSKSGQAGPRQGKGEVPYNPNAIKNRDVLVRGKKIKHRVFGSGSILHIQDEQLHVQFQGRQKVLSISTCLEMGLLELV